MMLSKILFRQQESLLVLVFDPYESEDNSKYFTYCLMLKVRSPKNEKSVFFSEKVLPKRVELS